jgi:formylglycine-generating enzyme required for sulfatase activity
VTVSRGAQRPVEFTALTKPFYFIPPPASPPKVEVVVLRPDRGPAEPTRRPGDEFRDCDECPLLVVLPPGKFEMGSDDGSAREQPVHEVTIDLAFAIGKYEVTFDEWDACVAGGGCRAVPDDHGWDREHRPVINVTWDDTQDYARWLSGKTGHSYRLPSEAEWEYAARGGTTTAYPWGGGSGMTMANCGDCGSQWSGSMPAPVGSFPANPFGLHDMNGNVWEWIADCAHGNYRDAPTDGTAWISGICAKSVLRGGSFRDPGRVATSSFRAEAGPAQRREDFGFRVVRVIRP